MKRILILLATCLSFIGSAQADSFIFSYTFGDSNKVTGSFDGSINGDLVIDLSNISVAYNGAAFDGNLFGFKHTDFGTFEFGGAVASFSGTKNNFGFADSDLPDGSNTTNYFASYTNSIGGTFTDLAEVVLPSGAYSRDNTYSSYDPFPYASERWTLTNVTAVPEPETYAMLLAGLGLIGAAARRRKAKQA